MFTEGDANSVDTWSNIPYFLSQNLEQAGAIVYKTDISPSSSPKAEKFLFLCIDFAAHCLRKSLEIIPYTSYAEHPFIIGLFCEKWKNPLFSIRM